VAALAAWADRELTRGRVVPPTNLHLTLAFLGSRPAEEREAIAAELAEAAAVAKRPVLRARGYRETRSVGMLALDDEDGRAAALAEAVHERLERLGVYRREARTWLPHVTVLRFRERPRLRPSLPDLGAFSPSEAAVYHSVLRPTGAQYEVLNAVRLGG
jgi:RNA 2',3'-cyclic 3'-phosphodiesterase